MTTRRAFSVAVFARHEGSVLLIKHRRLGTWLPVGGEIEAGETPLEAAARELREETGLAGRFASIAAIDGTPAGLVGYEEHVAGAKGLHMNFVFVADVDTRAVTPNDEFTDHAWVASTDGIEAPSNVHQLARVALAAGFGAAFALRGSPPASGAAPERLVALARAWLDAFNGRDLDRLLALYDADAVHTSPKLRAREPSTNGQVRGVAALRAWWEGAMDRLPGLRYEERHVTAMGDRVFVEYLRTVPGEEPFMVAEVFAVGPAGTIVASHVYHG